jgi:hypothetical protein
MTGVLNTHPKRPVPPAFLEWVFLRTFRFVNWLDHIRKKHPTGTKILLVLSSMLVSHLVWIHWMEPILAPLQISQDHKYYLFEVLSVVFHFVVGGISFVVLTAFIPFVLIAQRAIAMHALGLAWVSITGGDIQTLLNWYLRSHPEAEHVRVICLSGDTLFGAAGSPLRRWADRGKIDAVMPISSSDNATIRERYKRYSEELRRTRYPTIDKLVGEVAAGKSFLARSNNAITEHNILCMWRVVILQNFCLVQNYFPNLEGNASDAAPTFVYRNTGSESYYQMYIEMFDLIKSYPNIAQAAHAK